MAEATYPGQGAAIAFKSPVLRCAGLTKTFGAATALDNVSFSVPRGRVVGLLVSYLPERPYFSPSIKVARTLDFFADFYADFDRPLAEDMLARLQVPPNIHMGALSKGTKEKVQLVLVMARRAMLYLLDEPIGGVDPATRDYILDTIIGAYRREATILLSTHLVADVERVLDDFIFLQYGTMVLHAPVAYVHETFGMSVDDYFRGAFRC